MRPLAAHGFLPISARRAISQMAFAHRICGHCERENHSQATGNPLGRTACVAKQRRRQEILQPVASFAISISGEIRSEKTIQQAGDLCRVAREPVRLTGNVGGRDDHYWHEDPNRSPSPDAPQPAHYRALSLETAQIAAYLKQAHAGGVATDVSLPLPEGGFAEFMVVDSGTMPPELQKKYPDILSFKGSDATGRRIRLDVSPLGFQAMVFDKDGSWLVRPEVVAGGTDRYLSYRRSEVQSPDGFGQCEVHGSASSIDRIDDGNAPMTQTGVQKRVYRAAVAANNKYIAAVGGGTAAGGLAATVVAINRVTEVYEYDMSIQLTLVPNNDLIMYPTASSDPFSGNGTGVINNSTSIISAAIGAANYDIGHVFTTGSGGVAGLGVVCSSGSKGRGTTGLPNPTSDDFYIDFVAHEMGHQFGGNHPFNGSLGNCSGSNRNGSTAYEPGSGTTVMAYAGICGADDLQPHSDPYFHAISLQEINNYTNGSGNCSVNTSNPNQAPVINTANLPTGLTIPARTPFALSGSATDADAGDTLTYSWEEWPRPASAADRGRQRLQPDLPRLPAEDDRRSRVPLDVDRARRQRRQRRNAADDDPSAEVPPDRARSFRQPARLGQDPERRHRARRDQCGRSFQGQFTRQRRHLERRRQRRRGLGRGQHQRITRQLRERRHPAFDRRRPDFRVHPCLRRSEQRQRNREHSGRQHDAGSRQRELLDQRVLQRLASQLHDRSGWLHLYRGRHRFRTCERSDRRTQTQRGQ
jgi:hypothetical protein